MRAFFQNCLKEIKIFLVRWRISYLQSPPNLDPGNIYASQKEVSIGHLEWHTALSPWYCKYLGMHLDRKHIWKKHIQTKRNTIHLFIIH